MEVMRLNELKIGDKIKFHKGSIITSGFISYIYPSGKFLMDDTTVWGSDIIAKIEEKEIPIDKTERHEFIFDGKYFDIKTPLKGEYVARSGKRFKVTVEEME